MQRDSFDKSSFAKAAMKKRKRESKEDSKARYNRRKLIFDETYRKMKEKDPNAKLYIHLIQRCFIEYSDHTVEISQEREELDRKEIRSYEEMIKHCTCRVCEDSLKILNNG